MAFQSVQGLVLSGFLLDLVLFLNHDKLLLVFLVLLSLNQSFGSCRFFNDFVNPELDRRGFDLNLRCHGRVDDQRVV